MIFKFFCIVSLVTSVIGIKLISLYECLKSRDCALDYYFLGNNITQIVANYHPDIIQTYNLSHIQIEIDYNNMLINAQLLKSLEQMNGKCSFNATLLNFNPFLFFYNQDDKQANLNCLLLSKDQYLKGQNCFSSLEFNIYQESITETYLEREKIQLINYENPFKDFFSQEYYFQNTPKEKDVKYYKVCLKQGNSVKDAFYSTIDLAYEKQFGKKSDDSLKEIYDYLNILENICFPNCEKCKSLKQCEVCQEGYSLQSSGNCIKCHSSCQTCFQKFKEDSCLSCKEGDSLYKGKCFKECPTGYISYNKICEQCNENCEDCEFLTQNCTKCKRGYKLQNNQCQINCQEGYYFDSQLKKCNKCPEGCIQCSSQDACDTCDDFYIQFQQKCLTDCPDNYLKIGKECQKCNENCFNCQNSLNLCIECQGQLFLQNQKCVKSCDSNYFQDNTIRRCLKCHPSCSTCRGPTNNDCIDCSENYCNFTPAFNDNVLNKMTCIFSQDSFCKNCDKKGYCLQCQDGHEFLNEGKESDIQNKKCVKKCFYGKVYVQGLGCTETIEWFYAIYVVIAIIFLVLFYLFYKYRNILFSNRCKQQGYINLDQNGQNVEMQKQS